MFLTLYLLLTPLKLLTIQKVGSIKFHFSVEVKYFPQIHWAHKGGLKPCY